MKLSVDKLLCNFKNCFLNEKDTKVNSLLSIPSSIFVTIHYAIHKLFPAFINFSSCQLLFKIQINVNSLMRKF